MIVHTNKLPTAGRLPEETNVFRGRLLRHRIQTLLSAMAELLTYPIERLVERRRILTDVVGNIANRPVSDVRRSE